MGSAWGHPRGCGVWHLRFLNKACTVLSQLVIFWEFLSPLQLALLQPLTKMPRNRALEKGILMIFGFLNMSLQRQIQNCWLDICVWKGRLFSRLSCGKLKMFVSRDFAWECLESNHDGCRDDSHDHLSSLIIPVIFTGPSYCFPGILIFFSQFLDLKIKFLDFKAGIMFYAFSHPLQRFVRRKPLLSAWYLHH